MATETKLRQLADKGCPVYYFYSSERYLVRQAVTAITVWPSASYTRIFFFQAEDGIRATSVTGVQTCALPI